MHGRYLLISGFPVLVDYDREAVLYISSAHPQPATDTDMTDEGFLLRYRDDRIVGVTVLDASARLAQGSVLRRTAAWKKWHC